MSAVLQAACPAIRPLAETDIRRVMTIERRAYQFPWSEAIFYDCLRVGYGCWALEYEARLAAYGVMSVSAGEAHILNLCVDPDYQRIGLGRRLLLHLLRAARRHNANTSFIEVRPSNFAAIRLYLDNGFAEVGARRNYYQTSYGREDALILARTVTGADA